MKLKEEDIVQILKLRQEGVSVREISKIFGISPRRVQQIIKNPDLKRPGRRKIQVPPELKEKIISLRNEGNPIDQIHQAIRSMGYPISRYKIWSILKEHQERKFIEALRELQITHDDHDAPVFLIGIVHTYCRDKRFLKILVICDVVEKKVMYCREFYSLTLREIISVLDLQILNAPKPKVIIMLPVPPLVPTRGNENRLTSHLKNLGIQYKWIPNIVKQVYRKDIKRIKKLFRRECTCSDYIIWEIEKTCRKLLEGQHNGDIGQHKKIPEK